MELFPLWNSLRVAGISTVIIFFAGIFAAYYIAKAPRFVKGVLDVVLTLPLVLPPTVVGYLLLRVLGPKRILGAWFLETFSVRLTMTTAVAKIADHQVMVSRTPKVSRNHAPRMRFGPRTRSRR